MLIEFFVLGSVAFWMLMATIVVFGFICAAWEDTLELTVFVAVVTAAVLLLASDVPNKLTPVMLLYIPAWLTVGLVWSFPRWIIFLRKGKRAFDACEDNYQKSCAASEWGFSYTDEKLTPPIARKEIGRIVNWILLWPWSMAWTVFGDGVVECTRWTVEQLSGLYQRIADHIYE